MSARNLNSTCAKAAVSVSEMARLFTMSRSRFYDLIHDGVVPQPVYCIRTRRPLYIGDMISECLEVRRTNMAIDGRYVVFYERSLPVERPTQRSTRRRVSPAAATVNPQGVELVESLRGLGVTASEDQISAAVRACCPSGITDLEAAVATVFRHLRRSNVA